MKTQTLAEAIVEGFSAKNDEIKEGALVAESLIAEEEDDDDKTNESFDYVKEMSDMDDETKAKLEDEMKDMTEEEKADHVKKVKESALEAEKNL